MTWLNPPKTFAESMRAWMSLALFGAGVVCTMIFIGVILIVWLGEVIGWGAPWPKGTEEQRLSILGWAGLGMAGGMGMVIVSLAVGGPVGRFRGGISKGGLEFEASGDEPTAQTVAAAAAGGAAGAVAGAAASKEQGQ